MPALITPFDDASHIDRGAHHHNVATMWDRGVEGVLIGGSTGEGPYLEPGERYTLAITARHAAPDSFVMVGVTAESLRMARAAIEEAVRAEADAVLVSTPTTLVRHRPDLIEGFFEDVATASPVPIFLYSVPRVTALELASESVERLAGLPAIVGMKDSGGDPDRLGRLAAACEPGFLFFAGASAAVAASVEQGAHGAITASTNYATALVERAVAGDGTPLTTVATAVERFGIPAVKHAAMRTGLIPGLPRRPLRPPTPEQVAAIDQALTEAALA